MDIKKSRLQAFLVAILLLTNSLLVNAETVNIGGINYHLNNNDMTAEVAENSDVSGSIDLPASLSYEGKKYALTSIGESAFYYCEDITSVAIPASVVSIGKEAFADCIGITSMKVASGNKVYDSREDCNAIIETASNKLVVGCKVSVVPDGVTSIGEYAFYKCYNLASIILPESVTSIGDYAFYKCYDLASVNLPKGLNSIGESAFWRCDNFTTLVIPASVVSIGDGAFYECKSLGGISVASGNKVYDSREGCNAIIETASNKLIAGCKASVIPLGVTSIGESAFAECDISSVTLPESVISVGIGSFWNCSRLKNVYCYGTEKKEAAMSPFSGIAADAVLHVHGSLLEAYKADENWAGSFSSIEALPGTETGISQVVDTSHRTYRIYTIDGKSVPTLQRGINILHTSDGKSVKVVR